MIGPDDERWMRVAIEVATQDGADPSQSPIGAVLVREGKVIARGRNRTDAWNDATAHAEMVAFREAAQIVDAPGLDGAVLYSTLQPCGMCTMATIWTKVGRIVFGAGREDVHRMYFEDRNLDTMDFVKDAYRDDLVIDGGCLKDECAALYFRPSDDVPESEQGNL
ncbi:nucleoside deaminase [Sphingomonas oryzagri]|uniref:Nucleoside deaminase n=1 Tax=Sphingomonas oryzagri TaxID=3042314 RepID=A0ABT6MYZ4_9SPHN|nr:nucleoside deaminase [Sphingomonas oryzagri]MDH7638212.1 nucleoside deaminase [Sphingomonas oryzagri]